jgi:hypothetical protein
VSLSWRDRVTITLSPGEVRLLRHARGVRASVKDSKVLPCAAASVAQNWRGAIEVLREALTHPNVATGDATVVLSNHFVRYMLLPFQPNLVTQEEELAFARARFAQVFGEVSQEWSLKISRSGPGVAGVASAVSRALLESLSTVMAGSPLRLKSVQPALMAVCNGRSRLPRGEAWIVFAETGSLLLGAMRSGEWVSVRSRPVNGHAVPLAKIIGQEALLLGLESDSAPVYLHRTGEVELDLQGLDARQWLTDESATSTAGVAQ